MDLQWTHVNMEGLVTRTTPQRPLWPSTNPTRVAVFIGKSNNDLNEERQHEIKISCMTTLEQKSDIYNLTNLLDIWFYLIGQRHTSD